MAKKYHLKPDGNTASCRAFIGNCPFEGVNDTANHFPQEEWARKAFELRMAREAENDTAPRPASLANYTTEERAALVGSYVYQEPTYEGYGAVLKIYSDEEGLYVHDGHANKTRLEADNPYFKHYPFKPELVAQVATMVDFNEEQLAASKYFQKTDNSPFKQANVTYLRSYTQDFDFASSSFPDADRIDRQINWYRTEGVAYTQTYLEKVGGPDKWNEEYWTEELEKTGSVPYPLRSNLPQIAQAITFAQSKGLITQDQSVHHLVLAADAIRSRESSELSSVRYKSEPVLAEKAEVQSWLDDLREGSPHRVPYEERMEKLQAKTAELQKGFDYHKAVHDEAEAVYTHMVESAYNAGKE